MNSTAKMQHHTDSSKPIASALKITNEKGVALISLTMPNLQDPEKH